jgi:hypothetical protein
MTSTIMVIHFSFRRKSLIYGPDGLYRSQPFSAQCHPASLSSRDGIFRCMHFHEHIRKTLKQLYRIWDVLLVGGEDTHPA